MRPCVWLGYMYSCHSTLLMMFMFVWRLLLVVQTTWSPRWREDNGASKYGKPVSVCSNKYLFCFSWPPPKLTSISCTNCGFYFRTGLKWGKQTSWIFFSCHMIMNGSSWVNVRMCVNVCSGGFIVIGVSSKRI